MNSHKNASLTPRGREHLVKNIASQGARKAADAAGVSTRTASRWKRRHQLEGAAGLRDRSSRPHRSPTRIGSDKTERIEGLRRNQRLGYAQIAERIGAPRAVRAVAQACASNRLAVAIPCHRIVRNDGALSGYRWGVERKRALLANERAEGETGDGEIAPDAHASCVPVINGGKR